MTARTASSKGGGHERQSFQAGYFARPNGNPYAAIVLGDEVVDLTRAYEIYRASAHRNALTSTDSILDVLQT
jgi:hypothetical protein